MSGAFRLLAAGSSPGEALVARIDGVPAGLPPAQSHLEEDRARRRRHGRRHLSRQPENLVA